MRRPFLLIVRLVSILSILSGDVIAQINNGGSHSEEQPVLATLAPPVYPQMARLARVTGDVTVQVELGSAGTILSANIMNGSPLLRKAVLDSAQKSTFYCSGCMNGKHVIVLTYTFNLREDIICGFTRLRSVRCLYLWKCGYRDNYLPRPHAVARSGNHISVLADSACIQTSFAKVSRA